MKNLISAAFICALTFISLQLFGQKLVMENDVVTYDKASRSAITVTMEPSTDDVRDSWENYLEDTYNAKLKGNGFLFKNDVVRAEKVSIPAISDKTINIYAQIIEDGNKTKMYVFANHSPQMFLTPSSHPYEYRALENITLNFLNDFLTGHYENQITESRELVEDIDKKRMELAEDIQDNKEEIVELKEENKELKKDMTTKGEDLEEAQSTLEKSKKELDEIAKKLDKKEKKIKSETDQ